jgi:hypothetical protein
MNTQDAVMMGYLRIISVLIVATKTGQLRHQDNYETTKTESNVGWRKRWRSVMRRYHISKEEEI